MRILYIHDINRVASTYAREFSQRGHITALYEPDLRGAGSSLCGKLLMLPLRVLSLRHLVARLQPASFDLTHIHWASYGVLDLLSQVPVVVHCHGSDVRRRLRHPLLRPLLAVILRRAAAVLCITPDLLPIVRSVRSDAVFSPAPIDTQQFAPVTEQAIDPHHLWTILLFARLDPEKGTGIAMAGIRRFTQRHANIRVRLIDWGPLKEEYRKLYAYCCEFVPPVSQDQVQQLIVSANVVVGQFALGALGLSELQAMSCARPVICSFHYDEVYPTPPPLCRADVAEEIDAHLELLFLQPEMERELGQQARAWVISHHSHHVLADKLEALYCSILGWASPRDAFFEEVGDERNKGTKRSST
ncbi:hypothetical protein KDH_28120 [Dictyobacter sp. S3.2.2.5]|uniref:Glycosyltransferase subfamily 4-like N-terminal domain-containing protein n=1 Tax=Dictyobacter halimunensis TaxID=3026934 RepID=A0ABQ6FTX1_9CHLR|nr:hypothetical protein KDH_28120 [Dictyobacter sp. S3.2.2.5]